MVGRKAQPSLQTESWMASEVGGDSEQLDKCVPVSPPRTVKADPLSVFSTSFQLLAEWKMRPLLTITAWV